MRRYANLAIAVAVACSLGLASAHVSAASRDKAGSAPPKLKKGVTLHMWDFFDSANKSDPGRLTMERIVKTWSAKTGVKVSFDGHPDNSNGKMCTAAPSGTGPDIIGVPHDQVSVMYACKALASVPSWAWTAAQQKQYIKAGIQSTKIAGKFYAMPWAIETTGLWYNKNLIPASAFKTSGKAPLAWSKLIPRLQAVNDPGSNKFALGWDINNFYFDYAFLSNTGGYVFKFTKKGFDYNNLGLANAGAIRGLTFIKDLTTAGKYKLVPSSMTGDTAKGLFTSGKLAVYLTGPWDKEAMTSANIPFGFAPVPSIDGKHPAHPFSGLQVFSVNAYSKNKNEAFALVSYMTRAMQLPEFKTQGRIPVLTSLLKSKAVQSDPVSRGLASAALSASPMPNIPEMNQVWTPMGNALTLVTKGQASPADAARQAEAKIKSDIAKAHGG